MVAMYALESRGRDYILGFACGCLLSSVYGFLAFAAAYKSIVKEEH